MEEIINKIININFLTEDYDIEEVFSVPDELTLNPDENAIESSKFKYLCDCIKKLDIMEQLILCMRYGLFGNNELTLKQSAKILGYKNIESVRVIEKMAIYRLRHPRFHLLENCYE